MSCAAQQSVAAGKPAIFDAARLEQSFRRCFESSYRTRLCGGADEPLYQPAAADCTFHVLHYRADYFASALHEVAHWCIAGSRRRLQLDFGYWYAPEGRSEEQQAAFEQVECMPQALEWFFSHACRYPFQISLDNFQLHLLDAGAFKTRLCQQARYWQKVGLPTRANAFYRELCREYGTSVRVEQLHFDAAMLR